MFHPILLDVPSELHTARLRLRPPRPGDGAAVFAAVAESLPALRQFLGSLPWAANEPSVEASEVFCRTGAANFAARQDFPYLLWDRATETLVGVAGLHRADWKIPKAEIGYWCRTSRTGAGLITEAVGALVPLAFSTLRLARLELITDAENRGSRGVAERCDFTLEGVLRHERRAPDGGLRDTCVYAKLAPAE